jgi:hypothetical protein
VRLFQGLILWYVDSVELLHVYIHNCRQVSGVIRTVVADTHLSGGTKVLAGDRVVACVAEANLDVRSLPRNFNFESTDAFVTSQKNVFGRDPRTAVYNRTPVEYAGIMGIGPYG